MGTAAMILQESGVLVGLKPLIIGSVTHTTVVSSGNGSKVFVSWGFENNNLQLCHLLQPLVFAFVSGRFIVCTV